MLGGSPKPSSPSLFSPGGLHDNSFGQAVTENAVTDLARQQWALPVGNAAVSTGLLSLYLGAVWSRTLPDGAGSSRIAAYTLVVFGLGSIIAGHRLRKRFKALVAVVLSEIGKPPPGPHLKASSHVVARRSWRRHATRCRVRAEGMAQRRV
ncbi:MAG: hypothetical protein HYX32_05205 [Actinobacteria bacterium]|nr:hypothetical protein [Actinomycetota bacterium]